MRGGWTSCAVDAPVGDDGRPPDALALLRLGTDFTVSCATQPPLAPTGNGASVACHHPIPAGADT